MSGEVRLCPHGEYAYTWSKCWPHEEATMIALPAAEFEAWRRVVEAARNVVGVINVGAGHRIDWQDKEVLRELASALRALPSARKEGSK